MVALLGQHKELLTKDSSNVVPLSMSSFLVLGMCLSVFWFRSAEVRSSVRMRTTFGGFGFSAVSLGCLPSAEGKQAESAQATASPRSAYIPMRSVLFVRSTAFAFVSADGSRRRAVPRSLTVPTGLGFIKVKCYTFPRWTSPTPEHLRNGAAFDRRPDPSPPRGPVDRGSSWLVL